jgi:hypothetical protein
VDCLSFCVGFVCAVVYSILSNKSSASGITIVSGTAGAEETGTS